ncbi:hypothetical protein EIP86_010582 [Pleurotus ostreatoroseus]|nr:hypothetical protein EIP86_010582 [Pleurotus ostreatoroseus]
MDKTEVIGGGLAHYVLEGNDTVRLVIQEKDNIARNLRVLKDLYRDYGTPRDVSKAAPPPVPGTGMGIELRNVTFQYPNSDGTTLALRNISFSIKPSSLVVIVGANGSGKSSLVNLLTGLHEPTSGEILMDGHSAQSYYKPDLQACIALLAQRHQLFNLSIAETIGIGDPDHANDRERIEQAARLGGAYDFVQRYNAGFDEIIQPVTTSYSSDYPADDQQLREVFDSIERQKDISGKIKLVVVDEPTSAMDPLGEFELFEKLRSHRSEKTMIFVTHRFGHLTKHADLILCMKDGQLVESGTHTDLIEQRGEYHRLYEIQACAFND